jgi:Uma2 family endonuclease
MVGVAMVAHTRTQAAADIPRRRFTVDEYHRMGDAGVLSEDDRVELLDGEIVQMSPIGSPHAGCVNRLTALFTRRLGNRATVQVQNPIVLDRHSEPQPDLTLLAPRADFYSSAHPRPRDVLLAIEVMDVSRGYDRTLKLPLYARAELREVWLVDVAARAIEVYRRPALRGYHNERRLIPGETLAPLAFPRIRFRVDELLGPPEARRARRKTR